LRDAQAAPRGRKPSGTRAGRRKARGLGGKPSALGHQEGVCGDAEHPVMVEGFPAPPFVVIQSQLVLQFLVVAFDPPAELDEPHELVERHMLGDGREPVLRGFPLSGPPLHQEPPRFTRHRPPVVAMSRAHTQASKP